MTKGRFSFGRRDHCVLRHPTGQQYRCRRSGTFVRAEDRRTHLARVVGVCDTRPGTTCELGKNHRPARFLGLQRRRRVDPPTPLSPTSSSFGSRSSGKDGEDPTRWNSSGKRRGTESREQGRNVPPVLLNYLRKEGRK